MKEVVIVSAARTPFGKLGGALKQLKAVDLGGLAIKEALSRAGIAGDQVDEVVYGMVVPAGQGQIPGRQASVKGGIPHSVPVVTINKVCGSALKAVTLGAQIIKAGDADVIVAGGMESMSNIPCSFIYLINDIQKYSFAVGITFLSSYILIHRLVFKNSAVMYECPSSSAFIKTCKRMAILKLYITYSRITYMG